MICAGIDAGSRSIKVVLMKADSREPLAWSAADQGVHQEALAMELLDHVLRRHGLGRDDVKSIVATGYGRNAITAATDTVTEITCHARGISHVMRGVRTIVEIGGQDSKFLRLDADGTVHDFAMNDRCAAGTGRFLEVVAGRLGLSLDDLGAMAKRSTSPSPISSMCVVFAETEIIGLLAGGARPEDIVAGVQASIAQRVCTMAGRNVVEPVAFTGGVAMIPGMADALSEALGHRLIVAPQPQMTGALGAALLACEQK